MNKIQDYVIPVVLAVLAFVGILIMPGSFLVHPDFEILVDDSMVTIKNKGWVQAKNVNINIQTDLSFLYDELQNQEKPIEIPHNCPEDFDVKDLNIYGLQVNMKRVSVDLECVLVVPVDKITIDKVVVTSDDSPPSIWKNETSKSEQLTSHITELYYLILSTFVGVIVYSIVKKFLQ